MSSFVINLCVYTAVCSVLLIAVASQDQGTVCSPVKGDENCICKTTSGKYLDLLQIASANETNPKFKITHKGFTYILNPCYGVNLNVESGLCNKGDNMVACQQQYKDKETNSWGLGSIDTQTIYENNGSFYVMYTKGQIEGGTLRSTRINLLCDSSVDEPTITTEGDTGHTLEYVFSVTSKELCLENSNPAGGSSDISGPIGIVVIFLAIAGLITYFIAGILINILAFHKSGSEVIPQKTFWVMLPGLLKDGVLLTFSPIIRLTCKRGSEPYEPLIGSVQQKSSK